MQRRRPPKAVSQPDLSQTPKRCDFIPFVTAACARPPQRGVALWPLQISHLLGACPPAQETRTRPGSGTDELKTAQPQAPRSQQNSKPPGDFCLLRLRRRQAPLAFSPGGLSRNRTISHLLGACPAAQEAGRTSPERLCPQRSDKERPHPDRATPATRTSPRNHTRAPLGLVQPGQLPEQPLRYHITILDTLRWTGPGASRRNPSTARREAPLAQWALPAASK